MGKMFGSAFAVAIAIVVAGSPAVVPAQQGRAGETGAGSYMQPRAQSTGVKQRTRAYDLPKGQRPERLQGQHQVSGTVASVDRANGLLTIEIEKGTTMQLRFAPEALQSLNPGDQITVNLGFSKDKLHPGLLR